MATEQAEMPVDTMGPLDKLMTADMARLMGDNQRVLDWANRRAEAFAKWEARKVLGEEMPESADDMQISIDSPTTTNNYTHAPPKTALLKPLAALALGALIPGAGIGGFLLSKVLTSKPEVTVPATEDNSLDIGLLKFGDLKQ